MISHLIQVRPAGASAPRRPRGKIAVLAHGFRIFFLMGALTAPALLAAWMAVYAYGWSFPHRFPLLHWHGHAMLFGFAGAMLAGFLLTAPGNWTGRPMPRGPRLGVLAMLWLAGRAAGFFPRLIPGWLAMVVDVAFPLALAGVLVWALRGLPRQRHNLIFPALLLAMAASSGLSHLQLRAPNGASLGTELMLYLILWVIAVMGGRVIPGFTRGQFPDAGVRVSRRLDLASIAAIPIVAALDLLAAPAGLTAAACLVAAALHGYRLVGWYTSCIWGHPLLWSLQVGYAWMVAGFAMKVAALVGLAPPQLFRHAFTAGVIGGVLYGMICRIALGHTGRPLILPRFIASAMVLLHAGVAVRVLAPWVSPSHYLLWIKLSGTAWALAYAVYLGNYAPILWRPRVDGRDG